MDFIFRARYIAGTADACSAGTYCSCGVSGPPAEYALATGPTMVLTDGSDEGGNMLGQEACEWLVAPALLLDAPARPRNVWPPADAAAWRPRLTLVPDRVSMKVTGSLRVYDGADAGGALLWDCAGCANTAPPPLEASGDTLYVEYVSDGNSA